MLGAFEHVHNGRDACLSSYLCPTHWMAIRKSVRWLDISKINLDAANCVYLDANRSHQNLFALEYWVKIFIRYLLNLVYILIWFLNSNFKYFICTFSKCSCKLYKSVWWEWYACIYCNEKFCCRHDASWRRRSRKVRWKCKIIKSIVCQTVSLEMCLIFNLRNSDNERCF